MWKRGLWIAISASVLVTSPYRLFAETWNRLPILPHAGDDFAEHPRGKVLVTGLKIGRIHITFETTSWSDLRRQIGSFKLRHQGDASDAETWTCFTVGQPNRRVQIWLSGSEMTGGEWIDGVTAAKGTPWPVHECPLVDVGPGLITLDNGIWIGATQAQLQKRLGKPTAARSTSIMYDYAVSLHDQKHGDSDISGRISLEMKGSRVQRLSANKVTTN